MKIIKTITPLIIALLIVAPVFAGKINLEYLDPKTVPPLPKNIKQLLIWSIEGNSPFGGSVVKESLPIKLYHYLIPWKFLEFYQAQYIDFTMPKSMVTKIKGEKYYRWIIHPLDNTYHLEILKLFAKKNIEIVKEHFFVGYLTESRSMFIQDPINGDLTSLKMSAENVTGMWKRKPFSFKVALWGGILSEHIAKSFNPQKNKKFAAIYEPLAVKLKSTSMVQQFRDYSFMFEGDKLLLPVFSALHHKIGKEIALGNNAKNIAEFWRRSLIKVWGEATAEALFYYHFTLNSPHAQNWLLEVKREGDKFIPTGKLFMRDLFPTFLQKDLYDNFHSKWKDIINWHYANSERLIIAAGPFKGNNLPNWIHDDYDLALWVTAFFNGFKGRFSHLAGAQIKEMVASATISVGYLEYMSRKFDPKIVSGQCAAVMSKGKSFELKVR